MCILEKHRGHKVVKIEAVCDNQYTELEKFRDVVELYLSLSAKRSRCLHERKQCDLNIYTTIKGKIAEREIEMKQSVTAEAAEQTKKLDEIFLSVDKFIHKEMNTIQN